MIADMPGRLVSPITIGREAELEAATRSLDAAVDGHPSHLLVAGEAGVGKSRYVSDVTAAAEQRGMLVLRGSCANVGDGGLPYAPIVEILRELAQKLDPDELATVVGPSAPDLVRLVPALSPVTVAAPVQQQWLQVRVLEALLGLLHRLAERTPVVVVVEDLHWADPATRETVAFLARGLRSERALLLLTFRSDELHRRHPLLPWLAELDRTGLVTRIDLVRLDAAGVRELLGAILGGRPDDRLVRRVHARSDGNPFFAEELLAAGQDAAGRGGLSATLEEVLLARIAVVPEESQPILAAAAVAGRRIDHDLLAEVVGGSGERLHDGLRAAIASSVLVAESGADGDGYAFRHALYQEVVYEDLLPGERRQLHRTYAEALTHHGTTGGGETAARWAEIAYHWLSAHEDLQAFSASLRAGDAAAQTFAFEAALHRYEAALGLWAGIPDAETVAGFDHAELLTRAAEAANLAGLPARNVALRREALAVLDPAVDRVRLASMHEQLGRALWGHGDSAEALAENEQAIRIMPVEPPTAERARVLSGYGQIQMLLDQWQESSALCEEAIAIAREVGAREAEGHARNTLGLDRAGQGRCDEAIALLEEALVIALEVGNIDDIGRAHVNLSEALNHCGLSERAAEAVDAGVRAADAYGMGVSYGAYIRHNGIAINYDLGRWEEAARLEAQSRELIFDATTTADRYRISRWAPLLVATGDFELAGTQLERLREMLEGVPTESQFSGNLHAAAGELALWQGRPLDGLTEVEQGLDLIGDNGWRWFNMRLLRLGAWAAADAADLARARRDTDGEAAATTRGEALRARRDRLLASLASDEQGPQREVTLAEVATMDAEDRRREGIADPAAWRVARDRWTELKRPYPLGYCAWREAEAHLGAGDRVEAALALRSAFAIASELGARPLREATEALARRARIDLATRPASAASDDPFGLTRREREVLALVAQGRTNRQIADELFISENTAGVHVSNILGKLDVASRTEAAAVAVRLDLDTPTAAQ